MTALFTSSRDSRTRILAGSLGLLLSFVFSREAPAAALRFHDPGLRTALATPRLESPLASETERNAEAKPLHKPGLALLASVLVPGAGQLWNGDARGYFYLGIEAAAWFTRASYLDAGNKKEGEYEAYARQHWGYGRYHESAGEDGCNWTERADSLILWFEVHDPQQYYEELGKLEAYRCGWDDFREHYDPDQADRLSPHRSLYRNMRKKSNDLLDRGQLALTVAVLNRIVSGIDAFQTARHRVEGAGAFHLESDLEREDGASKAVLRVVWNLP